MPDSPFNRRGGGPGPSQQGARSPFESRARGRVFIYELRPTFGSYLSTQRGNRSLRDVAVPAGINHTLWRRLELGEARAPSPDLLRRIAAVLSRPVEEVFEEAGVRPRNIEDPRTQTDEKFRLLALHPALRPGGMTEEWLESFSTRQKHQIVEMLCRAGQLAKEAGTTPQDLLDGRDAPKVES